MTAFRARAVRPGWLALDTPGRISTSATVRTALITAAPGASLLDTLNAELVAP